MLSECKVVNALDYLRITHSTRFTLIDALVSIHDVNKSLEEREVAFDELELLVEQIDNANGNCLKRCFYCRHY
jgi:hypothetical protein